MNELQALRKLCLNLRHLRLQKGVSQIDFAESIGLSLRTVQRIENCESNPTFDFLIKASKYFDIDVKKLIHYDDHESDFTEVTWEYIKDVPNVIEFKTQVEIITRLVNIYGPEQAWKIFLKDTSFVDLPFPMGSSDLMESVLNKKLVELYFPTAKAGVRFSTFSQTNNYKAALSLFNHFFHRSNVLFFYEADTASSKKLKTLYHYWSNVDSQLLVALPVGIVKN